MARRTLINLDERILKETVRLGARYGLGKISAKTLAANCDITDTTIFSHFKNKRNLIQSAALYVSKHLEEAMTSHLVNGPQTAYLAWRNVLNYLLKHSDEALFISGFRHSVYYTKEYRESATNYIEFAKMCFGHSEPYPVNDDLYMMAWNYGIDSTFTLARRISQGLVEGTDSVKRTMFYFIYSNIVNIDFAMLADLEEAEKKYPEFND